MAVFLLIDDDATVLIVLSGIISKSFKDVRIVIAKTGEEGLKLARSESPDIILLDIFLPDIIGVEVARKLKTDKKTQNIPIILITASSQQSQEIIDGIETGAEFCLQKPFEKAHLVAHIKASLRIKQAEDLLRSQKNDLERRFKKQTQELLQSQNLLSDKIYDLEKQIEGQTQELIRADRLAAMGVLSAGIAHEINNPTTFIRSNLQTFRLFWESIAKHIENSKPPDDSSLQKRIKLITKEMPGLLKGMEEGCSRITSIVRGMKQYLINEKTESRVVNLKEVVSSALRLTANQIKHDIKVYTEFPDDMPHVLGSEQLLHQVIVNLILNATNIMREYRGEGELRITGSCSENYAIISVIDNGPGIEDNVMKSLFNPFFTMRRDNGGTGLGLFVTHGIVKGHNGTIEVETEQGKGSVFHVKLPKIEKEQSLDVEVEE